MPRPAHRMRRDIQGLRAIAVALVLVYHLSPEVLPGGYIGVDVFFVISGFLITGQLLREAETSGTVDLVRFWARRARRLLPAALLVLAVTLLAVWLFAPRGYLPEFLVQVAASAGYVQNWILAGQSVDYMAAEAQVSPVQHYWSLSVEEQFYIVWPLVAVLAVVLAGRFARARFRPVFAGLIACVGAASLAASITLTAAAPAQAYFVTTTRAWEFAAGGLLAWAAVSSRATIDRVPQRLRIVSAWIGLAGIAAAAFWFSDATPFPGVAALLPVIATVLVIAAQEPSGPGSPTPWIGARPMHWLGDISYGAYLWHFPLIVLLPFVLGRNPGVLGGAAVIAATLLLAWASKVWVEDPFRTGLSRDWPDARALAVTSAGMVALLAGALAGMHAADAQVEAERDRVVVALQDPDPCLGASALDPKSGCEPLPEQLPIPEPALASTSPERCLSTQEGTALEPCEYGATAARATHTIALVGDSHAEQWLPALAQRAEEQEWRLIVLAKASCPFTAAERDFANSPEAENLALRSDCVAWNDAALQYLADDPSIDTVMTAAKSTNRVVSASEDWHGAAERGYTERWSELPPSIHRVIAIRDTPQMVDRVLQCVSGHGTAAADACSVSAHEALGSDPLADAAQKLSALPASTQKRAGSASPAVEVIDMSEYFIVDDKCPPVIGGVLAFRDSHHLSWAYAEMLSEPFAERISAALTA
ncbi:acyltransferase family protein [Leucobacter sp. NPDC077196]|uniref:acyltransferase family protein n=1 Tax=Leucobacter sp. NPDC077196 TaxID=3154959 RepID=UPI00341B154F